MTPKPSKQDRCDQVYLYDCHLWHQGIVFAGIDEAGRGPLAGDVTAACVIMPMEPRLPGVYDSKRLTPKQREVLFDLIQQTASFVGIGWASPEEIDRQNILNATKLAMKRAAEGANVEVFLLDAVSRLGLPGEEWSLKHGDATSYSIAAASIIAKVSRDRVMEKLDQQYPEYGFSRNKGYGTREHIQALKKHGPCPVHRNCFIQGILRK